VGGRVCRLDLAPFRRCGVLGTSRKGQEPPYFSRLAGVFKACCHVADRSGGGRFHFGPHGPSAAPATTPSGNPRKQLLYRPVPVEKGGRGNRMILDRIENAMRYRSVGARVSAALNYLRRLLTGCSGSPPP